MPAGNSNGGGRDVLRLDDLFGDPLVFEFRGVEHRVDADALTMGVAVKIQSIYSAMQKAIEDGDDQAAVSLNSDLTVLVDDILGAARPPLEFESLPPLAVAAISLEILRSAFGDGVDPPPPPPNRQVRRTAAKGTRTTKS